MSSCASPPTCGARARTTFVDPSQREAVWRSWNGRKFFGREGSDGLYRDHVAATCHGASSFGESSSGGRTERVYEDARRAWAGITTGPLLRGWNHHVSMVRLAFAFIVAEPLQRPFPPVGRKKLPAESVASPRRCGPATRPERHFRDSFITVRLAVPRVLAHMVTPMPPVSTDRDRWTAWCTCP